MPADDTALGAGAGGEKRSSSSSVLGGDLKSKSSNNNNIGSLRGSLKSGVAAEDGVDPELSMIDSDEEKALLAELLAAGKAAGTAGIDDPFWPLCCLRTRKFDVARALQLLSNYNAFKADLGVDEVQRLSLPPPPPSRALSFSLSLSRLFSRLLSH